MTKFSKLTPKQAAFVEEHAIDMNATQAAIRAGYSKRTAKEQATRLLSNVHVAAEIAKARDERSIRTEITADRVLQGLAAIAFADPRKLFTPDGGMRPMHGIDDDTRGALIVEVIEGKDADGNPTTQRRVKFACKLRALEALARHLGLLQDKLILKGEKENPLMMLIMRIQGTAISAVHEGVVEREEYDRAA
jgi:phage terminase small subunit